MQKVANTGNYLVDYGIQEQRASPVKNFIPAAPANTRIKQFVNKGVAIQETTPKWKELGFESDNEYKIAIGMKNDGFSKDEVKEALSQYRTQAKSEVKLQEEIIQKEEKGIGGTIAAFGQSIKPFKGATDIQGVGDTSGQLQMAGKMLTNLPGDTIQLGGDIISLIESPIETAKGISSLARGVFDKIRSFGFETVSGEDFDASEEEEIINAIGARIKEVATTPEELGKLIQENPADIMFSLQGAGSALKLSNNTKIANIGQRLEETMKPIAMQVEAGKLVGKTVGATGRGLGEGAITLTGVATGLTPDTIKTIFKNPDVIDSGITKESVANKVVGAIDERITEVGELGKGYDTVKQGNIVTNADEIGNVKRSVLDNFDTKELTKKDQNALADAEFYLNKYDGELTDSNILALRQQLDSIKYDESGNVRKLSKNGNAIVTQLRGKIDEIAKSRIEGLTELDKKYASEITELTKVKKMIFDRNGDLKDNYIQQISNLTGKGKEIKIERIKKLVPEIEVEINAVKALENVEYAKGRQIGAYLQGGGMVGLATGVLNPVAIIVGLMLSSPTIVSNIVRAAGYSAKTIGSITEKIRNGIVLTVEEANIVSKAVQSQINEQALKGKESLGGLVDDVADKVGVRSKFMDDTGTGMSGKIEPIRYDQIVDDIKTNGGITLSVGDSKNLGGQPYIAVSPYPNRSKILKSENFDYNVLENYIIDNADKLLEKGHTLGAWIDDVGDVYLDVTLAIPKKYQTQAIKLGEKYNQKAVFDLETFEEISTKGTGKSIKINESDVLNDIKNLLD